VRFAVLSDVHGNAQALRAVRRSLGADRVDSVVCLGDVVGYGADPDETIAAVRDMCEVTVTGNHDRAVCSDDHSFSFNEWASEAILWTRKRLTGEETEYLRGLPLTASHGGALLVHSSPRNAGSWTYVDTRRGAAVAFSAFEERLCLIGHTHEPAIYVSGMRKTRRLRTDELTMEDGHRYLVNVGSVGQPRDGDARASYGIVDTDAGTMKIRRVEYDAELAGRRIVAAGLPVYLAERLTQGS
jgi:predicted phosphodiesterase